VIHPAGRAVRKAREHAGLSQSALARKARVGRVTLVRIETGEQVPTLETLTKLAKALGRPVRDLLGETS
jgi:transcriptional regulator with XRE-family HTH domain